MPGFASYVITYADYNGEKSTVRLRTPEISGAAVDYDAMLVEFVALQDAIAGITLGVKQKAERVQGNTITLSNAATKDAQRESKWLVQYHDGTTLKRYSLELPCADASKLDPNDRANAQIGDAATVDAFIDAFEAYAVTPDGNAPIVDEITLVGRNV